MAKYNALYLFIAPSFSIIFGNAAFTVAGENPISSAICKSLFPSANPFKIFKSLLVISVLIPLCLASRSEGRTGKITDNYTL